MRLKYQLFKFLGWATGYQHGHNPIWLEAPNHGATLTIKAYDGSDATICVLNSESPSDQVWLGTPHKWTYFYGGKVFRKMALWVLWRWVWGDWFGLKTKVWLWALDQREHKCS